MQTTSPLEQYLAGSYDELMQLAEQNASAYSQAKPFPSIHFDNLFKPEKLRELLSEFPELGEKGDIHYANANESKYATSGEHRMGLATRQMIHVLNSQPFLDFVQVLTGIKETLVPDAYLEGGGLHQIKPGGFLKIHVDFHRHRAMNLDRRVNVLVYLNEDWKEEYGGHFELWEKDMSQCVTRILPLFNRMAIFSTTGYSYHGHPDPLTCPPERSRKSMALYYYSNGRPDGELNADQRSRITTTFAARKGQDSQDMVRYNKMVNFANDVLPPFVVRTIKKLRNT